MGVISEGAASEVVRMQPMVPFQSKALDLERSGNCQAEGLGRLTQLVVGAI